MKWAAYSTLYFVGLLSLITDAPAFIGKLIDILHRVLPGPVAFMLVSPLIGFLYIFIPIAGTITFATWGTRFLRARLAASCVLIALLYVTGSYLGFHRNQWLLLDAYMCAGLLAVGAIVPATKVTSWIAFILLVVAYGSHFRTEAWKLFDYSWSLYFLGLSVAACKLPIARPETHST